MKRTMLIVFLTFVPNLVFADDHEIILKEIIRGAIADFKNDQQANGAIAVAQKTIPQCYKKLKQNSPIEKIEYCLVFDLWAGLVTDFMHKKYNVSTPGLDMESVHKRVQSQLSKTGIKIEDIDNKINYYNSMVIKVANGN